MARRRMTAKQAMYFGRRGARRARSYASRGYARAKRSHFKIPILATAGLVVSAMRLKDIVTYLNGRYLTGAAGPKYNLQEAIVCAVSGTRMVYDATAGLRFIPIGATPTRPLGDMPTELGMLYGPLALGIAGSKFVGGNGMGGIPGLRVNSMFKLPLVKL